MPATKPCGSQAACLSCRRKDGRRVLFGNVDMPAARTVTAPATRTCRIGAAASRAPVPTPPRRVRVHIAGRWLAGTNLIRRMVDGETVRAHLRALMDAGMGWKRIASLAGVSSSTVSSILYGEHRDDPSHPDYRPPRKQMRRRIADALLGVRLDLADRALVDATGARRRLQALVVVGWSQSRLAQMVGMTPASLGLLIHGRRDRVLVSTAAAVQRLYDAHWAAGPVPTNRAERSGFVRVRAAAVERGWVPAMAWDDDMIDDPAAQPCMGDVITGVPARVADAIELLDSGEIPEQIAGRLGVTLATLTQNVRRYAPDRATVFNAALGRWRSQAGAA